MDSELKKYKARIFGEIYSIVSNDTEDSVLQAISMVDSSMKEIALQSGMTLDSKKIAVLTALKAFQQLYELQKMIAQEQIHSKKIISLLGQEELSI